MLDAVEPAVPETYALIKLADTVGTEMDPLGGAAPRRKLRESYPEFLQIRHSATGMVVGQR